MRQTDLEIAVRSIDAKKSKYDAYFAYYDGEHPLVYNSAKLREVFSNIDARFSENWCGVVVDSTLDRLHLLQPRIEGDEALSDRLTRLWEESGILGETDLIHESLLVVGEAFLIVWLPDETDVPTTQTVPNGFWNDPRLCHAEYSFENPRELRFGAKSWFDDEYVFMTLYYPDRIEYYKSRHGTDVTASDALGRRTMPSASLFTPDETTPVAENPYGRIPFFHYRRSRRKVQSDLASVIEIQDAINKLIADMMIAAEFGAFRQRYVISSTGVDELVNGPNIIWDIPASAAGESSPQVGEFSATDLGNYITSINKLATDIGVISRTPRHYFFSNSGDPSGEALRTMESPLVNKCRRIVDQTIPIWRAVGQFLLELDGVSVEVRQVEIDYAPLETALGMTTAQIRSLSRAAGIPLITLLRDEGWTPEEIEEMRQDMEEEQSVQAAFADQMMQASGKKFDQGAEA